MQGKLTHLMMMYFVRCSTIAALIIPVVNEVFGEHYSGQERISFSPNEHFLNQQNGNESERITDSSFRIEGEPVKRYHIECQSGSDSSMLISFLNMTHRLLFLSPEKSAVKISQQDNKKAPYV